MEQSQVTIAPARGKLGVLLPGLGAVSTTLIAGLELIKKGLGRPIGSLTQYGTIRLGKRTENNSPLIKDFVPLAGLDELVFGCWDLFADNAYDAAVHAGVIEPSRLGSRAHGTAGVAAVEGRFRPELRAAPIRSARQDGEEQVRPGHAIDGRHRTFSGRHGTTRMVMLWCGSTDVFMELDDVHKTLRNFEDGLKNDHPAITPSMIYAYASLMSGRATVRRPERT